MKSLLRFVLFAAVALGMMASFLPINNTSKTSKKVVAGIINLPSCSLCQQIPR